MQQAALHGGAGAAKGQDAPAERPQPFAIGGAYHQEAPAFAQVSAVHHQGHFRPLPVGKQVADQLTVATMPTQLPVLKKAPQPLNQVLPPPRHRQTNLALGLMTIGADR